MSNQAKKFLIVILVLIILIIIFAFVFGKNDKPIENTAVGNQIINENVYFTEDSNGNKTNISEQLKKPRKELGYYIDNITLKKQGVQTIFKIQIENQTLRTMQSKLVDIVFLDKNGAELSRMALYIREIKAGDKVTTQATINNDFTNVYNFKLEVRPNK